MNGIICLFIGGIAAYLVKGFLGESGLSTLISIIVGFIVMGFVATL